MKRRMKDAFPPVDLSFERSMNLAFDAIRKEKPMRNRKNVRRTALLAAILVLLATAVGFATNFFQSTFFRMRMDGFAGNPTADYEKLDGMADSQGSSQTAVFSGATAEVALEQSYYNGEQLILGWTFKGPDTVEFYEKGDPRFAEVHSTGDVEEIDIQQRFSAETVDAIYNKVVQDHWAGVFWYEVWLDDGVWIPDAASRETGWDGSEMEADDTRLYSAVERTWNRIGAGQRYYECETPLPQIARNQQTLRILCRVYMCPTWLCYEGEIGNVRASVGYGETEMREVFFDVPLSGKYEEKSSAVDAEFPNHSAAISIRTTSIYAQIDIAASIPEAWKQAWAKHEGGYAPPMNLDADCAFNYEVWARCGEETKQVLDMLDEIDGIENFTGRFVLPNGATELILRPVYANTGTHAGEEIVLPIP